MGLFSSKKTYVSSTLYNMAGPIEDRPNFLKTLIVGNALGTSTRSLPEQLLGAYTAGPGSKFRNFGRWAKDNYGIVGVAKGNLYSRVEIHAEAVIPHIPHDPDLNIAVQRVEVKLADYAYWAEQWIMKNDPLVLGTEWDSDYDETKNEVTIKFVDNTSVSFTPKDFRKSSAYIFATYNEVRGSETGPVVEGSFMDLGEDAYPDVSGWTLKGSSSSVVTNILPKIAQAVSTFSDNRPVETETTNEFPEQSYNFYKATYERVMYHGAQAGSTERLTGTREILNLSMEGHVDERSTTTTTTTEIAGGVTKTTVTTVNDHVLVITKGKRVDTQELTASSTSSPQLFIYRLGSGNPMLDKLVAQQPDDGYYFPFIPLRLDNQMVPDINQAAYEASKKAYKKATTGSYDGVIDSLKGNKDLKDIDYAYIMFGVSLNTKEATGKKYLYDFFEKLRLTQEPDRDDYLIWRQAQIDFDETANDLNDWRAAQYDPNSDLYGTAAPTLGLVSAMPANEIRIRGNGSLSTNLDIQITWQSITKTHGVGLGREGAKVGDCWITTGEADVFNQNLLVAGLKLGTTPLSANRLNIYKQVTTGQWEVLSIIGLNHKNFIYKGKYVEISSNQAMADSEESGFLVPLHFDTYKEMSLVDATQLASACCYLVINSYLVKKTGFFSSFFFKILLVVVVIAITYFTGGFGASSVGLLGTNAAVGAAIGLTGTLAIIAGAVANAIVAMIVAKLISIGAVAVFGEKLGSIIGAIASVVTLQVGTAMAGGSSLAASISQLARVDNIIAITSSVGSGISGYIQAGAAETMGKTADLQKAYDTRSGEISDKYEEEFGYGRAMINPAILAENNQFTLEGPQTFLDRTLMTGSDVAELSLTLISNFTDITLSTELKF